jgi:hypothetical protein
MSIDKEIVHVIRGKALYAKVQKPEKFDEESKSCYSISVVFPSDRDDEAKRVKEILRENKLKQKLEEVLDKDKNPTGEVRVSLRRTAFIDDNGVVQNPLLVVDKYGDKIPNDILVGNGSDVLVSFTVREYIIKQSGKTGTAANLTGVQVATLVPYTKTGDKNVFKPLEERKEVTLEQLTSKDVVEDEDF